MKRYVLFILFIAIAQIATAQSSVSKQKKINYTIAPWFNNKKAAVSLTLDDGIKGQFNVALPMLERHGYKATFFVTVKLIDQQLGSWSLMRKAALAGHEIANHALTHPHFTGAPLDTIAFESTRSNQLINGYIPSQKVITHAYPFGDGGGNTAGDKAIRKEVSRFFIAARATRNKPYAYNKYDFAATNDDYYNINSEMITDSASMADFGKNTDQTIAAGGWLCVTYHGIADGWIITPADVFEKHLTELDKRKADIWVAPFKNVVQYHKERNCAKLKALSKTSKTWQLLLTDTLQNANNWNQPLTINLDVNGRKIKSITQKGTKINFVMDKSKAVFNAIPGQDRINIKFL